MPRTTRSIIEGLKEDRLFFAIIRKEVERHQMKLANRISARIEREYNMQEEASLVILPRVRVLVDEGVKRGIADALVSLELAASATKAKPRLRLKLAPAKARLKE